MSKAVFLKNLKSGERLFYKDKQNTRWDVKFDGKNLSFSDRDCSSCSLS